MLVFEKLRNKDFRYILLGNYQYYKHSTTKAVKTFYPKNKEELDGLIKDSWLLQRKIMYSSRI